jgi:hypothetical protein
MMSAATRTSRGGVVGLGRWGEDLGVGDVQDLDGDREADLDDSEDGLFGSDAKVMVGRGGDDHRRFAAALAGRGC